MLHLEQEVRITGHSVTHLLRGIRGDQVPLAAHASSSTDSRSDWKWEDKGKEKKEEKEALSAQGAKQDDMTQANSNKRHLAFWTPWRQ